MTAITARGWARDTPTPNKARLKRSACSSEQPDRTADKWRRHSDKRGDGCGAVHCGRDMWQSCADGLVEY